MNVIQGAFGAFFKSPKRDSALYACLGHTDKEGFSLREKQHVEELSTAFTGDMVPDGVYIGKSMTIHMTLMEVGLQAVRDLLHQEQLGGQEYEGVIHHPQAPMGRVISSYAGSLKLLPLQGTSAYNYNSLSPGSGFLFSRVYVQNGQEIEKRLAVRSRLIPIVLGVIPYRRTILGNVCLANYEFINEVADLTQFNFAGDPR